MDYGNGELTIEPVEVLPLIQLVGRGYPTGHPFQAVADKLIADRRAWLDLVGSDHPDVKMMIDGWEESSSPLLKAVGALATTQHVVELCMQGVDIKPLTTSFSLTELRNLVQIIEFQLSIKEGDINPDLTPQSEQLLLQGRSASLSIEYFQNARQVLATDGIEAAIEFLEKAGMLGTVESVRQLMATADDETVLKFLTTELEELKEIIPEEGMTEQENADMIESDIDDTKRLILFGKIILNRLRPHLRVN